MKKGSIIGKRQIVLAVLVAALGVAVWLNMKYASTDGGFDVTGALNSSKYLGDAQYVNNASVDQSTESVTTSAAAGESTAQTTAGAEDDYFAEARENRENTRKEALELIQDTLSDAQADSAAKEQAVEQAAAIASRMDKEAAIENLLKAKDFADALVMIGDSDVNVVVKAEGELISSQTMQIQDAVQSQTDVELDHIKIVSVK